ncbi:hypothetical protein PCE1_003683 [Barthelona sp. PCE]
MPVERRPLSIQYDLNKDKTSDYSSGVFTIVNEDHTLGNVLKFLLNRHPNVILAGYTIPHPLNAELKLRIQCKNDVQITDVLLEVLDSVEPFCDTVYQSFNLNCPIVE